MSTLSGVIYAPYLPLFVSNKIPERTAEEIREAKLRDVKTLHPAERVRKETLGGYEEYVDFGTYPFLWKRGFRGLRAVRADEFMRSQ